MIVRKPQSGQYAGSLLLIRQTDHAALSRDLAAAWGGEPFAGIALPEFTMPAILHHDDGWDAWEKAPKIDAESGRPQSFLNTSAEDSHRVWMGGVRRCAEFGPLAQYLVAKHFLILREHSSSADTSVGSEFLDQLDADCDVWLAQWWESAAAQGVSEGDVELALRQLRFFDWFSLWLCLADRDEEYQFPETPDHHELTLLPREHKAPASDAVQTIGARPWPWRQDTIDLSIAARVVPDRAYQDGDDLMREYGQQTTLRWRLTPDPSP
ncbi:MAG: DUF3891 family protein [Pirellulaceae bacterium]